MDCVVCSMLTVETFVCKAFRTHAHTKQPTIQNSTSATMATATPPSTPIAILGQLFPNVHGSYFSWFPNNNNVTKLFIAQNQTKIELQGSKRRFFCETCSLNDLNICYTPHYVMKKESLLLSQTGSTVFHFFSLGRKRPKLTPGAPLLPSLPLPTELNFLVVCMQQPSNGTQGGNWLSMLKGYNSTLDANVPSLALIAVVVEPSQEPNLNLIPYS